MRGHRPRLQRRLLDRNTLREVSRLIDVAAAAVCNVIGEQLERNRLEDRQQKLVRRGNGDVLIGILLKFLVVLESEFLVGLGGVGRGGGGGNRVDLQSHSSDSSGHPRREAWSDLAMRPTRLMSPG